MRQCSSARGAHIFGIHRTPFESDELAVDLPLAIGNDRIVRDAGSVVLDRSTRFPLHSIGSRVVISERDAAKEEGVIVVLISHITVLGRLARVYERDGQGDHKK